FDGIMQNSNKGKISKNQRQLLCNWHEKKPDNFLGLSAGFPDNYIEYKNTKLEMEECGLLNIKLFPDNDNFWDRSTNSPWWIYYMSALKTNTEIEKDVWRRHQFSASGGPDEPPHLGGKSFFYYFLEEWLK